MELHDAQTGFRAGTRFESGRNYRTLKYTREEAEKEAGLETEEITGFSNLPAAQSRYSDGLETEEITGFSNKITSRLNWGMGLEEDKITWYSNFIWFLRML